MRMIAAPPVHADPASASTAAPWSAALNATADVGEISVTPLAVDVVDDQLCGRLASTWLSLESSIPDIPWSRGVGSQS